ncbi:hypothetical protein GN244_ATG18133 [Phytophthora infestans]|uniref:Uncharacterized protein n=1 Tax=Phytophthora infestans TaxID=4787 RepID=A0A833VV51_PHYIN|nr:hypothetical protein GN244_ATG18133 [Phytophthora infestans]
MSARRAHGPTQKHRAAPYDDAPPTNLKFMSNSERGKYYRRRRKHYGQHLETCVADLREEIAALTISRQVQQELVLSQRRTPLGAAAHVVDEYCSLFSHGAPVRLTVDEQNASASLVAQATNAQRGFLSAVMNDNVRFGEFLGVELLLGQWERYSLYHDLVEHRAAGRAASFDCGQPPRRGAASGVNHGGLARAVLASNDRGRLEVTYPCVNHFHFNEQGKIEWYAPEVDFVSALTKALGRPGLVARVVGHALIEKDHMIGDGSDGRKLAAVEAVEEEEVVTGTRFSETDESYPYKGTIFVTPPARSKNKKRLREDDGFVAVVSDDEPSPESPESSPKPLNRLNLAYILAD